MWQPRKKPSGLGMGKLWPGGQIRPAWLFNSAPQTCQNYVIKKYFFYIIIILWVIYNTLKQYFQKCLD